MIRTNYIIAVFTLALTVMAPEHTFADSTSQRDAVYASEGRPIGGGSQALSKGNASDVTLADISVAKSGGATPQAGIVNTCAWGDEDFREEYNALLRADGNSGISSQATGEGDGDTPLVLQQYDRPLHRDDSTGYVGHIISIKKSNIVNVGGPCDWATEKGYYSDKYAVVFTDESDNFFPHSYKKQYRKFECPQKLVHFCKGRDVLEYHAFDEFGKYLRDEEDYGGTIRFADGDHTFGEYAFNKLEGNILIGEGRNYFDKYSLGDIKGTIIIGEGTHTFAGANLYNFEGYFKIGKGKITFSGGSYNGATVGRTQLKHKIIQFEGGNVLLEGSVFGSVGRPSDDVNKLQSDGEIIFKEGSYQINGKQSFMRWVGDIRFDNNSTVTVERSANNLFEKAEANIWIGDGNHSFAGDAPFVETKGTIYIGNGKHSFGNTAFRESKSDITILGSLDSIQYFCMSCAGNIKIGNDGGAGEFDFGKYAFNNSSGEITIYEGNKYFGVNSFSETKNCDVTIHGGYTEFAEYSFYRSLGKFNIYGNTHQLNYAFQYTGSTINFINGYHSIDGVNIFYASDAFVIYRTPLTRTGNISGDFRSSSAGMLVLVDTDIIDIYPTIHREVIVNSGSAIGFRNEFILSEDWVFNGNYNDNAKLYKYRDTETYLVIGNKAYVTIIPDDSYTVDVF